MMKMRLFTNFLFLVVFLLACKSVNRVTKTNLAYQYYNESSSVNPEFKVYHKSDLETIIYVKVKSSEILYSKNNPGKEFLSKMAMEVNVYRLGENKKFVSDTVFLYSKGEPDEEKYLLGELSLDIPYGDKYLAEVTFDDLYRTQYVQDVILIDKINEYSVENYLIKNARGEIQFGNTFDPGSKLFVETSRQLPSKVRVIKYDPYEKLPPPPFSEIQDFELKFTGESDTMISTINTGKFEINLSDAGIYHIPNEIDGSSGLTFLVFHSYFPYIKTVASMIRPMRYLTTKQEYENIINAENTKKEMDEFWLKTAGNSERATEIIQEYFTRVEIANKKFTSYTQGWQTDRGLIYLIYGPPGSVLKSEDREVWTYSEKSNVLSIQFIFIRIDNAYSQNDYVLERSTSYKSSWYRSIDGWRQGRLF